MFNKKSHQDVKKSSVKIQDSKKDSSTRLKHLKIVLGEIIPLYLHYNSLRNRSRCSEYFKNLAVNLPKCSATVSWYRTC